MPAPRVNKYFVVFLSSLCSRRARVDTTTSVAMKISPPIGRHVDTTTLSRRCLVFFLSPFFCLAWCEATNCIICREKNATSNNGNKKRDKKVWGVASRDHVRNGVLTLLWWCCGFCSDEFSGCWETIAFDRHMLFELVRIEKCWATMEDDLKWILGRLLWILLSLSFKLWGCDLMRSKPENL